MYGSCKEYTGCFKLTIKKNRTINYYLGIRVEANFRDTCFIEPIENRVRRYSTIHNYYNITLSNHLYCVLTRVLMNVYFIFF